LCWVFSRQVFMNYLLRLALNCDPPDLCLLNRWYYRHEPLCLAVLYFFACEFFPDSLSFSLLL
jgi:hypothetical protein